MSDDNIDLVKQYGKLSGLIDHVLTVDCDLPVSHYFQRFLGAAKFYIVSLKTKKVQEPKTIMLDVSDVNTCMLPMDFVDYCKVGEQYGQYVRTLALNLDLNKIDRTENFPFFDFGPPGMLPNGVDITNYGGYAFANYSGTSLFGVGGGLPSAGQFTIKRCDNACSELLLDIGLCSNQIYLEYISLGINPCGETVLHPYLWDCVRTYLLHWWETVKKVGKSAGEIQRTGRDWWTAEQELKACRNPLTPETVIAMSRSQYRLTNKA